MKPIALLQTYTLTNIPAPAKYILILILELELVQGVIQMSVGLGMWNSACMLYSAPTARCGEGVRSCLRAPC